VQRRNYRKIARGSLSALCLGAAAVALLATGASADIVLDCDFEHLPVGEPVPAGGAALGEPTDVGNTEAIIAVPPTMSKAVKINDLWTDAEGVVLFEFLNGVEVTSGAVTIETTFCFLNQEDYFFSIREQGGRSSNFADIYFTDEGYIHYQDENTPETYVWRYETSRGVYVRLVFDLDIGTYSLNVNGMQILSSEPHGVASQRGIGGLYMGIRNDSDTGGTICIDDVRVETTASLPTEAQTWTTVKNMFR
jgi:hypothetical protein